jgi:hypothetical protein
MSWLATSQAISRRSQGSVGLKDGIVGRHNRWVSLSTRVGPPVVLLRGTNFLLNRFWCRLRVSVEQFRFFHSFGESRGDIKRFRCRIALVAHPTLTRLAQQRDEAHVTVEGSIPAPRTRLGCQRFEQVPRSGIGHVLNVVQACRANSKPGDDSDTASSLARGMAEGGRRAYYVAFNEDLANSLGQ